MNVRAARAIPVLLFAILLLSSSNATAQIRDSLRWVTNGLQVDNRPNLNRYDGIKWVGNKLQASQVRKFVEMRPSSLYEWEDVSCI